MKGRKTEERDQLGGEVVQLAALQQGGDEDMEVGRASSSPADLLAFLIVARLTDLNSTTELARPHSSRAGRIALR